MSRRHPLSAAVVGALLAAAAVFPADAEQPVLAPAPVPGPVGLSVGNEARTAVLRAERWLRRNDPDFASAPAADAFPVPPDEAEAGQLLALLQDSPGADVSGGNRYEGLFRLARALAVRGAAVVFLPDGTSVPWRNAMLHELAATQHPDDRGGGCWRTREEESDDDALRSTRAAYAALFFLLGSPPP